MVEKLRRKFVNARGGIENCKGFLMSPVDDYIDDYDSKITKMNQLLERDLEYWKSKI